nr:hypothetical protein [Streptomyces canus]
MVEIVVVLGGAVEREGERQLYLCGLLVAGERQLGGHRQCGAGGRGAGVAAAVLALPELEVELLLAVHGLGTDAGLVAAVRLHGDGEFAGRQGRDAVRTVGAGAQHALRHPVGSDLGVGDRAAQVVGDLARHRVAVENQVERALRLLHGKRGVAGDRGVVGGGGDHAVAAVGQTQGVVAVRAGGGARLRPVLPLGVHGDARHRLAAVQIGDPAP